MIHGWEPAKVTIKLQVFLLQQNGVKGYVMVDDSGQNWWYPIGGWRSRKNGKLTAADTNGYYWCSSTDREKAANSVHLTLGKDDVKLNSNNSRANSSLIRCVKIQK